MRKYSYRNLMRIAAQAVQESEEIADFCQRNFGIPVQTICEMFTEEPPQEWDCPVVEFSPIGGDLGQGEDTFVREIAMRVAVSHEEGASSISRNDGGRVVWRGCEGANLLSDLLEMVYDALAEAYNRNEIQLTRCGETIESAGYSLFQARAELGFEISNVVGASRPDEE